MITLFSILKKRKFVFTLISFIWLLLVAISYKVKIDYEDERVYSLALNEARSIFNLDILYRTWVAHQGGIYVPITKSTPPNPFLKDPNRDVETKSGKKLTLINPAYMTRMVHDFANLGNGVKVRLTSLNPIRPENKPDKWEIKSLKLFEDKNKEIHGFDTTNGLQTIRFIAPFVTKKQCLKCHQIQGYKEGDIRGGISIAIPFNKYLVSSSVYKNKFLFTHSSVALIGLLVLFIYSKLSSRYRKELELEGKKFKTLLEISPEAIIVHSEGRIVYANQAAVIGFNAKSPKELVGLSVISILHPDYIDIVKQRIAKMLNYNLVLAPEILKVIALDGTVKEVEVSAAPALFDNKPSIIVYVRDLSELRKAYLEIQKNQESLNALVSALPDNIFVLNQKGVFLENYYSIKDSLYVPPEEFIGKNVDQVLPFEIANKVVSCINQLFLNGEQQRLNYSLIINGKTKHFEAILTLKGKHEVLVVARDITEKRVAEEALLASEEKYRFLVENTADTIALLDLNLNYLYISPSVFNQRGYTVEEAITQKLSENTTAESLAAAYKLLEEELKNEQSANSDPRRVRYLELEQMCKDGSTIWVEVSISFVRDQQGKATGILAVSKDITKRKKSEAELFVYRNNLEMLVKARTEELDRTNAALRKEIEKEKEFEIILQKSLEKEKELNEMKSRFISTTSHEFRTPLTSILSSTELLQRFGIKWSNEKKDEHFNRIINSVSYITKLLDDVLTISRTDTGKIIYYPEKIDLKKFAEECAHESKLLMTSLHELKLNYKCKRYEFLLDPKLMKFIFNNLLSNAAKYSPKGGIIEVNIYTEEKNIFITVKDEGIGIEESEIEKIFDSFYRTKNVATIAGNGLGLTIVKRAVELHGGEITLRSKINKGTTFIVKIPINT